MEASRHAKTTIAIVWKIATAPTCTACEAVIVTVAAGVALDAELLPVVPAAGMVVGLLVVELVVDEDGCAAAETMLDASLDELDVDDVVSKIVASDVKVLVEVESPAVYVVDDELLPSATVQVSSIA
ncbi:hypothetical protein B0A48_12043 [Cryoendolithus antarcticus]|uniref:Uncharacterized protein n=1 Tax=Cryoendolithus antarcticus TaxID=1507870 RepID=A0A1V8STP7_9PEZI|nr:hypothetical protein B0A48_12043 [Cryoendolithus antarcticus]